MLLYHGTSAKHLDEIIEDGLKPTSLSVSTSHWECESNPNLVYLSDTYALYYALVAGMEHKEDAVVFKLDSPVCTMYPDEDYMAQQYPFSHDLIGDTKSYRDTMFSLEKEKRIELSLESLNRLGTVSTPYVKPEQLLSYTRIPYESIMDIVMMECDPIITLMNHRYLSKSYQEGLKNLHKRFPTIKLNGLK